MKNKIRAEESNNLIIEYLTKAATHGGFYLDGIVIEPGTAVACMKTIAVLNDVSYYRVKKCINWLVESGRVEIVRCKGFALITFCETPQHDDKKDAKESVQAGAYDCEAPIAESTSSTSTESELSTPIAEQLPSLEDSQTISKGTWPTGDSRQDAPALSTNPAQSFLNRAARRKLARQEAKLAARRAKQGRVGV